MPSSTVIELCANAVATHADNRTRAIRYPRVGGSHATSTLDSQTSLRDLMHFRIDLRECAAVHRGDRHDLLLRHAFGALLINEFEIPLLQIDDGDVSNRTRFERSNLLPELERLGR